MHENLLCKIQIKVSGITVILTDTIKIMEDHGWSYKGEWKLRVYTTEDCVLEEFKIEASIILDPLDTDSDNDGILDGEEMVPGEDG